MDLMDLRGPDFLKIYAAGFVVAAAAGLILRRVLRGPSGEPPREATGLDPIEVAYLAGGPRLAINAALASLFRQESVRVTAGTRTLQAVRPPADGATAMEQGIYRYISVAPQRTVREVHQNFPVDTPARRPAALGLILSPGSRAAVGAVSILPLLILMLVGVAKVLVGASRDRPVVFLVLMLVVTGVTIVTFLATLPRRTVTGDRALAALRWDNAALRSTAASRPAALSPTELALGMALFGPAVLAADAGMDELRQAIVPASGAGGSSCGSGCGSGCGGGGGGGGCGGCGGGGGD